MIDTDYELDYPKREKNPNTKGQQTEELPYLGRVRHRYVEYDRFQLPDGRILTKQIMHLPQPEVRQEIARPVIGTFQTKYSRTMIDAVEPQDVVASYLCYRIDGVPGTFVRLVLGSPQILAEERKEEPELVS